MATRHPPTAAMPTTSIHVLFLTLFTILAAATVTVPALASPPSTVVFYVHENTVPGPEATRVEAASPSGDLTATEFGTVAVIQDPLRETADPDSPLLGVLSGAVFTLKDLTEYISLTWTLNTTSYAGSISAQGGGPGSIGLAVVGGTGDFSFVRGYSDGERPLSTNPRDLVRKVILTLKYD